MNDIQPDNQASGITEDGEQWSIARYSTTVVITIDGESDDDEYATVEDAAANYAHNLSALLSDQSDAEHNCR